jgi:hypothetical protein
VRLTLVNENGQSMIEKRKQREQETHTSKQERMQPKLIFLSLKSSMYRLLLLFILLSVRGYSQEPAIIGVTLSGGAMNYIGDLDDDSPIRFMKPAGAITITALPFHKFNMSISYLHGALTGDDAKAEQLGNKYRNINFHSYIDEISIQVIYRLQSWRYRFLERKLWVPYVFTGIGYFHFNPKSSVDGKEYELQKVGTEGQYLSSDPTHMTYPEPYKLWQFNIPFGIGVKYKLKTRIDIGIEFSMRRVFTDYLDDISGYYPDKDLMLSEQGPDALYLTDPSNDPHRPDGRKSFARRGDPNDRDWYTYTSLSVSYYFKSKVFKAVQVF